MNSKMLQSCQFADFESATTSKDKGNSSIYEGEDNFWLFQVDETKHVTHHAAMVDNEIEKMAKNLLQVELDEDKPSQEWMHILATIDTCSIPTETQFCDEDGYDIIPVQMIRVVDSLFQENLDHSATFPLDVPIKSSEKEFTYYSEEEFSKEETHATDKQYEKWQEIKLLKLD